jgi:hypothetical protein
MPYAAHTIATTKAILMRREMMGDSVIQKSYGKLKHDSLGQNNDA